MEIMFAEDSSASMNTFQNNFLTLLSSKYRIVVPCTYGACIIN